MILTPPSSRKPKYHELKQTIGHRSCQIHIVCLFLMAKINMHTEEAAEDVKHSLSHIGKYNRLFGRSITMLIALMNQKRKLWGVNYLKLQNQISNLKPSFLGQANQSCSIF